MEKPDNYRQIKQRHTTCQVGLVIVAILLIMLMVTQCTINDINKSAEKHKLLSEFEKCVDKCRIAFTYNLEKNREQCVNQCFQLESIRISSCITNSTI